MIPCQTQVLRFSTKSINNRLRIKLALCSFKLLILLEAPLKMLHKVPDALHS